MGFVDIDSIMVVSHVSMFTSHFFSMILDLSCVVHIIPIVKCLVHIYLCFGGYYEIQCLWGVFGIHYLIFA